MALTDFSEPGDIGVFIDEDQVAAHRKAKWQGQGYLDAGAMHTSRLIFLRANDLIWSFVINNYLLGKESRSIRHSLLEFDSTNLPAAMHSFICANFIWRTNCAAPAAWR